MDHQIVIDRFGGPEVMRLTPFSPAQPGAGQVLVRNTAIGLNFIDCYQRSGLYPVQLPFVPGNEAAGVIEAIGEGVEGLAVGDRIVSRGPVGAYATRRILPALAAIKIPEGVTDEQAAAMYLKAMTASYLINDTYAVTQETSLLAYAAAGGVGQILTAWAKSRGAQVIGIVSTEEKRQKALSNGCDLVLIQGEGDIAASVKAATGGKGVDVVYDSVGRDTFVQSLDCLKPRGLLVSFGNASGPVSVESLGVLASKGSLYVTRPTMAHYFPTPEVERAVAADMFAAFVAGKFGVEVNQRFALADVADAHTALESRKTTGATIIQP